MYKIEITRFILCNFKLLEIYCEFKNKMKNLISKFNKIFLFGLLIVVTFLQSCLIVKEQDIIIRKNTSYSFENTQKNSIKMSNKIIRSKIGDMIATIPEGWFFIEPSGGVSSEVFAIAVNPDYTMSAIFSHIKKTKEMSEVVEKEGVIGLSRMCFAKHNAKSSNNIKLVDNHQIINQLQQKFGFHTFTKPKNNTFGSSAVFISNADEYYEFSLVTMNFTSNDLPTRMEFDKIFYAILATIKY